MKDTGQKKNVLIIGGGASGMMAAITAARCGAEVTILEHTGCLGKKILATGNGKCNLTNRHQESSCYRSDEPDFAWRAYQKFTDKDTLLFFTSLGLHMKEKHGYVYPYSEQAQTVLFVLTAELKRLRVRVEYRVEITAIEVSESAVVLTAEDGRRFQGDALILSTGSKASPKTGSDGSGYTLAKGLGHRMVEPLPALVQLTAYGKFWKSISGVRAWGQLRLLIDGDERAAEQGEIQFADYGISGIPVFQISRYAVRALADKKRVTVFIDFLPDIDEKEVILIIKEQMRKNQKTEEEALSGLLHKKIALLLTKEAGGKTERMALLAKAFPVEIMGHKSYEFGQVCTGGVSVEEVDAHTMESKRMPGVYLTGELLDVDGACGGYNLQWAWTSGYLAGIHAGKGKRNDSNTTD